MPHAVSERSETRGRSIEGESFARFASDTRALVDGELAAWLSPRLADADALGPEVSAVARAVADLVTRGGKRLRAALVAAAYVAAGGEGGPERVAPALVAIELLQGYLLAHDDWMDDDDVRRGGPTVHAALRERFGGARDGAVGAVLAGDLAAGWSLAALGETGVAPERVAAAARVFGRMQVDVVLGQTLDVFAKERSFALVEAMHDKKTGSYTVRGPLAVGAALAGASARVAASLEAFAAPLGVAFQLRDDLLGAFGDPRATGKPAGGDLRRGKHTALVAALVEAGTDADRALVARVTASGDASIEEVETLLARLVATGARARVEVRLRALLDEAKSRLAAAELPPDGASLLAGAADALGERAS